MLQRATCCQYCRIWIDFLPSGQLAVAFPSLTFSSAHNQSMSFNDVSAVNRTKIYIKEHILHLHDVIQTLLQIGFLTVKCLCLFSNTWLFYVFPVIGQDHTLPWLINHQIGVIWVYYCFGHWNALSWSWNSKKCNCEIYTAFKKLV